MKTMFKSLTLFGLIVTSVARADEIKLTSDLWCPYACEPTSDKPGFMIEIAKEIFKSKGHTVRYELINWARAIKDTKAGKYDGIVGASKADVPGFVVPSIPTGKLENYYFTLRSNQWTYKGVESLKKVKMGVINDYSYGEEVDKQVAKKNPSITVISGNDALKRMIQMTEAKRLDGFVENPMVLYYTLMELKKNVQDYRPSSPNLASDPDLFIAFSPKKSTSVKYAKILDEGVQELRKNGKLKEILKKYGLNDWTK